MKIIITINKQPNNIQTTHNNHNTNKHTQHKPKTKTHT